MPYDPLYDTGRWFICAIYKILLPNALVYARLLHPVTAVIAAAL